MKNRNPYRNSIPIFRQLLRNLDEEYLEKIQQKLEGTKQGILLAGIVDHSFENDDEACEFIYHAKKHSSYTIIKTILRTEIIQGILSTDLTNNNFTDYARTYRRVNNEFAAYNILVNSMQGGEAAYLGELIISTSIKYEFLEFIAPVATNLSRHYRAVRLNKTKAEYFVEIQNRYSIAHQIAQKAKIYFSELTNLFVIEHNPGITAYELANRLIFKLDKYDKKHLLSEYYFYYYLIHIYKFYSINDFTEMDNYAKIGYDHHRKLKFKTTNRENTFLRKRVEANLLLGNYEFCQNVLHIIIDNSVKGRTNWYNTLDIAITVELHQKKYSSATHHFFTGKNHTKFKNIYQKLKQRWGLLEAYINFLQLSGAVPESPTMSRYRINKFINDTPRYSEDKKGRNIQLIIAQLLFYIVDKNWDKMEEKIEALQKYGTRYLRKGELFRSQVFIKMLLEIPKRMYHPAAIIRHTARYRKRLAEMKPNIDLNGSTLEIIPYEDLWELILPNIVPPKYTREKKLSEAFK